MRVRATALFGALLIGSVATDASAADGEGVLLGGEGILIRGVGLDEAERALRGIPEVGPRRPGGPSLRAAFWTGTSWFPFSHGTCTPTKLDSVMHVVRTYGNGGTVAEEMTRAGKNPFVPFQSYLIELEQANPGARGKILTFPGWSDSPIPYEGDMPHGGVRYVKPDALPYGVTDMPEFEGTWRYPNGAKTELAPGHPVGAELARRRAAASCKCPPSGGRGLARTVGAIGKGLAVGGVAVGALQATATAAEVLEAANEGDTRGAVGAALKGGTEVVPIAGEGLRLAIEGELRAARAWDVASAAYEGALAADATGRTPLAQLEAEVAYYERLGLKPPRGHLAAIASARGRCKNVRARIDPPYRGGSDPTAPLRAEDAGGCACTVGTEAGAAGGLPVGLLALATALGARLVARRRR